MQQTIKAVFVDGDGMTIRECRYFSEEYSEEHGVPLEKITPFFTGPFRMCQRGQADLKKELVPYLATWGWKGSVDEFLAYWFTTRTIAEPEILAVIDRLREKGYKCYLSSNNEKYRGEYLKHNLDFGTRFDGFYYSWERGYQKSDKGFFHTILRELGLRSEEVIVWDDEAKNVETAKELGIDARLYRNIEEFKKSMDELPRITGLA